MFFSFCGRDIADGLQDAPVVEPIDPCQGGKFNRLEGFPGAPVDEFGLVEAVDDLGERGLARPFRRQCRRLACRAGPQRAGGVTGGALMALEMRRFAFPELSRKS